jgi:RNA polymerase sigma factor (sigma-70 family)
MKNSFSRSVDPTLHLACQRAVLALIEQHDWALPREGGLVEWVLDSIQADDPPANLERLVYSVALYEACRQAEEPDRREWGYGELYRFLYRAAYNRWPELAKDATQRALLLVYEQIDRCRSPGTFLAFALFKLRHAFQQEKRARGNATPLEGIGQVIGSDGAALESSLAHEDRLRVILDTITGLPDERQQKAILLKYLGGLSDEEIGIRLQITANHVRVLRYRGLEQLREDTRLRDCFKDETSEEP